MASPPNKDKQGFLLDKEARRTSSQANIARALHLLGIRLRYDQFADRGYIHGIEKHQPSVGPNLDDAAVVALHLLIDSTFGFRPTKEFFFDVISNAARSSAYHPVRDYLEKVEKKWDKVSRIDRWLIDYCGAEDTEYVRAVGRLFLIAAVKRVREPGCKFDELLILQSPQGMLKSSALAVLAVEPEWFSDCLPLGADPKVVIEQTRGKWIAEIAELSGIKQNEVEPLKAFLSRQTDIARAVWTRIPQHVDRAFVVCGTTNSAKFLKDLTGNRRFWPVKVGTVDLKRLKKDRDQLWAEAATLEQKGESIRLDPSLWDAAAEAQRERQVENAFLDRLAAAFDGIEAGKISKDNVYDLAGIPPTQRHQGALESVAAAMRELGWEVPDGRLMVGKDKVRAFVKGTDWRSRPALGVTWDEDARRHVVTFPSVDAEAFTHAGKGYNGKAVREAAEADREGGAPGKPH